MKDFYYSTGHLSYEETVDVLRYCNTICYNWWLDRLDCYENFGRKFVQNDNFEEALKYYNRIGWLTIIHRGSRGVCPECVEVGTRASVYENNRYVEYFIWIQVNIHYLDKIVKKFNLG